MIRAMTGIVLLTLAAAFSACSNPAANTARAVTSEATEQPKASDTAAGEKLDITPDNSKIEFVGSKVTGSEGGAFRKFAGAIYLVNAKPEASRVEISIDMDSVVTDSPGLADHLKNADFFDAPKYPKATFVSNAIEPGGEKGATHTVKGNLELHGIKKAITFPATIKVDDSAASLDSEFAINRKDFGIMYAGRTNDLIRDEVVLKLQVRAPRAGAKGN